MTSRQPRHGPNDFYGSSGPPTPGAAWPPPPLWRPPVTPPARPGAWAEPPDHAPRPRRPLKHLVGYPATALLALAVGAAPSDGATTQAAPAASPTVTVSAPAPARTVTVTAPATTVTVTAAVRSAAAGAPGRSVYYARCADVRVAGAAPLSAGDPGYRPALDRDADGVACE